ncbi:MAG: CcmD family protein [bacterium]|nr:CcmD family protein [bacterium]
MKNYDFLFWAYNVIWIGLAAYIFFVFARVRRVDRRLDNVERSLGKKQD